MATLKVNVKANEASSIKDSFKRFREGVRELIDTLLNTEVEEFDDIDTTKEIEKQIKLAKSKNPEQEKELDTIGIALKYEIDQRKKQEEKISPSISKENNKLSKSEYNELEDKLKDIETRIPENLSKEKGKNVRAEKEEKIRSKE